MTLAGRQGVQHVLSTFRILIAGDADSSSAMLTALAPFGYQLEAVGAAPEIQAAVVNAPPDLLILDTDLPDVPALQLVRTFRQSRATEELPILVVLHEPDPQTEIRAFQVGADDVVADGVDDPAFRARVRGLLRTASARRRLLNEKRRLELKVADRTRELMEITIATVAALEKATELSDEETGFHVTRVASYSALLAEEMGLTSEFVEKIRLYAPLHDIGKIGVPHEILKKEGVLTRAEFEEMKRHTTYGNELLTAARADEVARNIALSHHERMDGSGYPAGIKGRDIPLEARIVAVADVFDALTTRRRYKEAMPTEVALKTITDDLGTRFDEPVIRAFQARFADVMKIFASPR